MGYVDFFFDNSKMRFHPFHPNKTQKLVQYTEQTDFIRFPPVIRTNIQRLFKFIWMFDLLDFYLPFGAIHVYFLWFELFCFGLFGCVSFWFLVYSYAVHLVFLYEDAAVSGEYMTPTRCLIRDKMIIFIDIFLFLFVSLVFSRSICGASLIVIFGLYQMFLLITQISAAVVFFFSWADIAIPCEMRLRWALFN